MKKLTDKMPCELGEDYDCNDCEQKNKCDYNEEHYAYEQFKLNYLLTWLRDAVISGYTKVTLGSIIKTLSIALFVSMFINFGLAVAVFFLIRR